MAERIPTNPKKTQVIPLTSDQAARVVDGLGEEGATFLRLKNLMS